jgi:hypothetical protein
MTPSTMAFEKSLIKYIAITIPAFRHRLITILLSLALGVLPKACISACSIAHIKVTKGFDRTPNICKTNTIKFTMYAATKDPWIFIR